MDVVSRDAPEERTLLLKHISSFLLSSYGFHASSVGGTKMQGKDASEGNVDAI